MSHDMIPPYHRSLPSRSPSEAPKRLRVFVFVVLSRGAVLQQLIRPLFCCLSALLEQLSVGSTVPFNPSVPIRPRGAAVAVSPLALFLVFFSLEIRCRRPRFRGNLACLPSIVPLSRGKLPHACLVCVRMSSWPCCIHESARADGCAALYCAMLCVASGLSYAGPCFFRCYVSIFRCVSVAVRTASSQNVVIVDQKQATQYLCEDHIFRDLQNQAKSLHVLSIKTSSQNVFRVPRPKQAAIKLMS